MVIRKASLASSLAWRVSLIHSLSESSSLMYHFQSCTCQIQPWDFFEVSQSTLPRHTHTHSLGSSLYWLVSGGSWAGPEAFHGLPQKPPSFLWPSHDDLSAPLRGAHTCAEDRCASSIPPGDSNSLAVNFLYATCLDQLLC